MRRTALALFAAGVVVMPGCTYMARTSVPGSAVEANAGAANVSASGDGRYVVFDSAADNLVPGDTNGQRDVFRYDRQEKELEIVSVSDGEAPGTGGGSRNASVSNDGRYVAFESTATNLVGGDTNGASDVFVRDMTDRTTTRVSVATGVSGTQANGPSFNPAISANAQYVAFASDATNLFDAAGDGNGKRDVFVRSLAGSSSPDVTQVRSCATYTGAGVCATGSNGTSDQPTVNDSGTPAFQSDATNFSGGTSNGVTDVFVQSGTSAPSVRSGTVLNPANGASTNPELTPSGAAVVFQSDATNLVAGDTNGATDAFINNGSISRVSLTAAGAQAAQGGSSPALSDDGRYVSFVSASPDVVSGDTNGTTDAFRRDRTAATTVRASVAGDGSQGTGGATSEAAVSGAGGVVAFVSAATNLVGGDGNGAPDAFVRDFGSNATERVSKTTGGAAQGNGTSFGGGGIGLSDDGRYVLFHTVATNVVPLGARSSGYVHAVVRDQATGSDALVDRAADGTPANNSIFGSAVSGDGRYVAFSTAASNLVAGDTNIARDVFVFDRTTGFVQKVSAAADGSGGDGASDWAAISADGRYVVFQSTASNLVAGDTNNSSDVFLRDRQVGTTTRVSVATDGTQANGASGKPAISANGAVVVFETQATNLFPGDVNSALDVIARDGGVTSPVSLSGAAQAANGSSRYGVPDGTGRHVAFLSTASDLVGGDTNGMDDVFVRDRTTGTTTRASVSSAGAQADAAAYGSVPAIDLAGRYVAFDSSATNLVSGDTNAKADVFLRDLVLGRTTRVSTAGLSGAQGAADSHHPSLSGNGRYVSFASTSALDPADTNGVGDVYLRFTREPVPTGISPSLGSRGGTVNVTISGSGFESGDQVGFTGGGVTVSNVNVVSDSKITATFQISPTSPTGARQVAVSRAAGGWNPMLGAAGACVGCFTVNP